MKCCLINLLFGVDFKLQVPPLTHNVSDVRNQVNNPDWRIVMTNYVCNEYEYNVDNKLIPFEACLIRKPTDLDS